MKQSKKTALMIVLAAVLAGAIGYMAGHDRQPSPASNNASIPQKERKVLYWYDPMVPNQHFDKPGKSPFMDMALVPMYDDNTATPGTVKIDPATIQNMGVRTAPVTQGDFSRHIDTAGYINPDEHRIQVVQTRAAGWVERLNVSAVNDPVKRGQLLLELYAPDLLAAQEEYLLARQNSAGKEGEALLLAAQAKMALLGITPQQIAHLKATGKPARLIAYFAPSNGIVTELNARKGAQVAPGTNLYSLVDLSSVWVIAEIPENQGGWIHDGIPATITVSAYPDKKYSGRVEYVYPKVTEATRTLQVRVRLANPDGKLKPGMFANVSLSESARQNVLTVPSEAVITTGRRSVVIVADGDGKFHPVEVQLGRESGGQYEIMSGLSAGQNVLISGQFMIDSESNLKTALDRLQPPPSASDALTASSAQAQQPKHYAGHGTVNTVDIANKSINITHDPIPALKWPGMTMDFGVKDAAVLASVKPGNVIDFELVESVKGEYVITSIKPGAK